ncbi:MAG: PQQ-binding-like beta-propeller repeat protein [Rubripirellula sp.]|nr:PQQ-binding-like beta-propeller repeat protein [Rubripirellula sp.]
MVTRFYRPRLCSALSSASVRLFQVVLLCCVGCFACGSIEAQEWPRFRGPNGSGIAEAEGIPSEWSEQDYQWVAELPGVGNSSPVVWGDRIFITAADEKTQKRSLVCLNLQDGTERWRAESEFKLYKKHKNNSFASATPAVDGKHVYQLWHSKQQTSLIAFDHDGSEQWRSELGPYLHGQGGATSPIVAEDLVIVAHDHKDESFLAAWDSVTGEQRWKIPREGKRACYSTPCVRDAGKKQELVFVHCYEGVSGVDLQTGTQNWHVDPFGRESQRALASPVVHGDLVIAGSGAVGGDRQIVAIEVAESAQGAMASEVYRIIRQSPHVPSPLIVGDRMYLWNDGGICTCCELTSGDVVWQKRVGGSYFSSPIAIGDRIFSIDTTGEVVVIAADDSFEILARNPMGQGSRASLAVAKDTLLIRTDGKLFAIRGE